MFNKDKHKKDGLYSLCKACVKAYYEANKEKLVEQQKAYNEANKKKISERMKDYYEDNKEKYVEYRKANKEKISENRKAHKEANKEKYAEYGAHRRARKRNAVPKFLRNCDVERQRLRDIFNLRDMFSKVTGIEHHVDHMWPLADGGPHWSGNLQIITAEENLSKSTKVCKITKKNIKDSLRIARKEYNEDSSNGHRD